MIVFSLHGLDEEGTASQPPPLHHLSACAHKIPPLPRGNRPVLPHRSRLQWSLQIFLLCRDDVDPPDKNHEGDNRKQHVDMGFNEGHGFTSTALGAAGPLGVGVMLPLPSLQVPPTLMMRWSRRMETVVPYPAPFPFGVPSQVGVKFHSLLQGPVFAPSYRPTGFPLIHHRTEPSREVMVVELF